MRIINERTTMAAETQRRSTSVAVRKHRGKWLSAAVTASLKTTGLT
jgi:hypothetical protein